MRIKTMLKMLPKLPEVNNEFCPPDCPWLSPTEEEQDKQKHKSTHKCRKFMVHLYHDDQHPNIYRTQQCCAAVAVAAAETKLQDNTEDIW